MGCCCEARLTVICLSRHQTRISSDRAFPRAQISSCSYDRDAMTAPLLAAAHGTRSVAGLATIRALIDQVRLARPALDVDLCFLDVLGPRLAERLDALPGPAVVVPVLLSAGYHVLDDIPA